MTPITVSINPWYFCNFRCDFCYLTEKQLSDTKLLPIFLLEQRIAELSSHHIIDTVDIYGGEVGLLDYDYILEIKQILHCYNIKNINIITNLSMINDVILDDDFYISVSYDFDRREKFEQVWKNMALLQKPFSVLMLASPEMFESDTGSMIEMFNLIPNIQSVEIKPYSPNQSNAHKADYTQFESLVQQWIESSVKKNFTFVNELLIQDSLDGIRSSFSDDHVYITPSGNYGVLEFDLNDNEFFQEYIKYEDYVKWCTKERQRVSKNKFCSNCKYFGHCLSEHLRDVKSIDNSCNGFIKLLEWYDAR